MSTSKSEAVWRGTLREGDGTMNVGMRRWEGPYTYASRFEEGKGTNPEELIGAAHAGCFSQFLASLLAKNGYEADEIRTEATVHLNSGKINKIELNCVAKVPEVKNDEFQELAAEAKEKCPVSNALASVDEIVMKAQLK